MSDSLEKCFSPATLAGLEIRNRVINAARFERPVLFFGWTAPS